jgi:aspartate 1-decarboxylase
VVIIASFASYDESELATYKPTVVLVDADNKIVDGDHTEIAGPRRVAFN